MSEPYHFNDVYNHKKGKQTIEKIHTYIISALGKLQQEDLDGVQGQPEESFCLQMNNKHTELFKRLFKETFFISLPKSLSDIFFKEISIMSARHEN